MHPDVCWYDLPVLYESEKDRFLAVNEGYHYRSYGDVFRRYFFKAKEPVAHPLWSSHG
jgi:fatty acid desaturase